MTGIPKFLLGTQREVTRGCRAVAARLIKTARWADAVRDVEFVPIEKVKRFALRGPLTLDASDPEEEDGDLETAVLFPFCDQLGRIAAKNDYALLPLAKRLLVEGCEEFWVALTVLAGQGGPLPMYTDDAMEAAFSKELLERLLPWWDELIKLDGQFFHAGWFPAPWPFWALKAFMLCGNLGMTNERGLGMTQGTPEAARDAIAKFIRDR